ncbi:PrgI family protein [Butyrivibrio sp. AE2015]|uniref:PrgI family protein n=1 Tax=Butyrivibrio sp. AE2015 TaxID=1280663 RepID=UPI0003B52EAA|nr:PrgI family protein [Butyrivibrio sp. AE2015]
MGFVRVPRDIKRVKPKFVGPLNKRQTYTMAIGIGFGLCGYFISKPTIGASNAIFVLIALMLPVVFCGLFEKDNRYLEDILKDYINVKFKRPGVRVFKTQNMYRYMHKKIYEKEVLEVDDLEEKKSWIEEREKEFKSFWK